MYEYVSMVNPRKINVTPVLKYYGTTLLRKPLMAESTAQQRKRSPNMAQFGYSQGRIRGK